MNELPVDPTPYVDRTMRLADQAPASRNGTGPDEAEDTLGWDPPVPLGPKARPPIFPAHRLPPWLSDYVVALAHAAQTPVDLPGVLSLSVLAAAAGGRAQVEIRAGYVEPLNLYTAVAMAPGSRKTPVFMRMTKPLVDAEIAAIAAAKPKVIEATVQRAVAEADAVKARIEAERAGEDARTEASHFAAAMAEVAAAITIPAMPRMLVDDATPEALASLLAEQGGALAMFSDEGDVFSMMAGRYTTKGPNLAVYLKGHVGSPLRVDRKGREPEIVARPALTLGLTLQPAVLSTLTGIEGARGRGLLGRFLWSVPASNVGYREIAPAPVPDALETIYTEQVRAIVASLAEWKHADAPLPIAFTPEGDAALRKFEAEVEPKLREAGGDLGHVSDWAAKLAGHTARIAGLLHIATHLRHGWAGAVDSNIVDDAIVIGRYFVDHALIAFDVMSEDQTTADARYILRWAETHRVFRRRDLHLAARHRFRTVQPIREALDLLESLGHIRHIPDPPPDTRGGRPRSPRYQVNPLSYA